jgi:hypothetical protein
VTHDQGAWDRITSLSNTANGYEDLARKVEELTMRVARLERRGADRPGYNIAHPFDHTNKAKIARSLREGTTKPLRDEAYFRDLYGESQL